jgi:hypothetical protein
MPKYLEEAQRRHVCIVSLRFHASFEYGWLPMPYRGPPPPSAKVGLYKSRKVMRGAVTVGTSADGPLRAPGVLNFTTWRYVFLIRRRMEIFENKYPGVCILNWGFLRPYPIHALASGYEFSLPLRRDF